MGTMPNCLPPLRARPSRGEGRANVPAKTKWVYFVGLYGTDGLRDKADVRFGPLADISFIFARPLKHGIRRNPLVSHRPEPLHRRFVSHATATGHEHR